MSGKNCVTLCIYLENNDKGGWASARRRWPVCVTISGGARHRRRHRQASKSSRRSGVGQTGLKWAEFPCQPRLPCVADMGFLLIHTLTHSHTHTRVPRVLGFFPLSLSLSLSLSPRQDTQPICSDVYEPKEEEQEEQERRRTRRKKNRKE